MLLPTTLKVHEPIAQDQHKTEYYRSPAHFRGYPKKFDPEFGKRMVRPHVESYNAFLASFDTIVDNYMSFSANKTTVTLKRLVVERPAQLPQTCRELMQTYSTKLYATVEVVPELYDPFEISTCVCDLPVMLGSSIAVRHEDNIQCHEDERDFGGYFIVGGTEKMLRLLVLPRRHYAFSSKRMAFLKRGSNFTEYGVMFRSVRADQRSQTLVLHAMKDGSACLRVLVQKKEFFIPLALLLRGLKQTSDAEICYQVLGQERDSDIIAYINERLHMMLENHHVTGLWRQEAVHEYLGQKFRTLLGKDDDPMDDTAVGRYFLERHVFWHLYDNLGDKFNLLCQMARQLYYLTHGKIGADNSDSTAFHEVLTPGNLLQMFLSECVEDYLRSVKYTILRYAKLEAYEPTRDFFVRNKVLQQKSFAKIISLIAMGNLNSTTGLDLMQINGYSVVADRLNYVRFMAHFRSIHRGAFFTEMKTTAVRKMLPESFGFLCVVHTPDGAPCGLLNHLCRDCDVCQESDIFGYDIILSTIQQSGLVSCSGFCGFGNGITSVPCFVDGILVGYLPELGLSDSEGRSGLCYNLMQHFRVLKAQGEIGNATEICYIPSNNQIRMMGQFAVFTQSARYVRKVKNLATGAVELIGSMEQLFLDIAILQNEIKFPFTTHYELTPVSMLSATAQLIPWPDHNQSPRNVYECQMLKQTMGFPARSIDYRVDAKTYRIMTPERPMVRTFEHDIGGFDTHPTGTNAIVGVMAYTGYDMEDACLINKKSLERGLFHGCVYSVHTIDLLEDCHTSRFSQQHPYFKASGAFSNLDTDGLPIIGSHIASGDALASYFDPEKGVCKKISYRKDESGVVERIILASKKKKADFARIVIRHDRNPIIGDKFASRHGQKGTLGIKFQAVDMPFCHVTGIYPDLLINPHAFPSRMTIGMLLESLAGKYCAQAGKYADATPFYYCNEHRCLDEYGNLLERFGYSRYGSEQMYSGITGDAMECQIFIGPVYYQRLRHMVNDKYYVRALGPIDGYTGYPIKGRSRGGGTRFGEMERDALIAHGTSAMLRGRLCCESDGKLMRVCSVCGGIFIKDGKCSACDGNVVNCYMPQAAQVLIGELAGMGVRMSVKVK